MYITFITRTNSYTIQITMPPTPPPPDMSHPETCREFCEAWCIVIWIVYELVLIIYVKTYLQAMDSFKNNIYFVCHNKCS
jgi:hypothetical protein